MTVNWLDDIFFLDLLSLFMTSDYGRIFCQTFGILLFRDSKKF